MADDRLFENRRFHVNGQALHALVAGPPDGPLAVLLHGFPEQSLAWHRQIPALAGAGMRVVAPDQRGYARSSKPPAVRDYRLGETARDVLALADALDAPRFSVVGHDWGGIVAWELAALHAQRLRQVVVLNAPHAGTMAAHTARHPTQLARSWYMGAFQVPLLPELALRSRGFALLRRAMVRTAQPGAFAPALLDRYAAGWAEPGALTAMLHWYRALPLGRATPAHPIDVPVTVIWGERDSFLDRRLADAALALCARGVLHVLPRATHWLHHEEPEEVNRLLLGALVA